MEEGSRFDDEIISGSASNKEDILKSETLSEMNMKHKSMASDFSTNKREDAKLNPSYPRETTVDDSISESNLLSATSKGREVESITSSTRSSVIGRANVHVTYDDKDRLHESDVGRNGNLPRSSSIPNLAKKMNIDEKHQFKGYLEKLLEMHSIKSSIIGNDEKKASYYNSYELSQPTYNNNNNNLYGPAACDSNAKKRSLEHDNSISVSIGTIILNVVKTNNDGHRDQVSVQKADSSHNDDSSRSRLYRYYGRLR
jgi:hypothetical protein